MAHIRHLADEVTAFILKNDNNLNLRYSEFVQCLQDRDNETLKACKRNRITNVENYLVANKTVDDLYNRLGNLVINTALVLKDKRDKQRTFKQHPTRRRIARKDFLKSLEITAWLTSQYNKECTDAFNDYLKRLKQAEHERDEPEL